MSTKQKNATGLIFCELERCNTAMKKKKSEDKEISEVNKITYTIGRAFVHPPPNQHRNVAHFPTFNDTWSKVTRIE